jgi:hypothetical protein
MEYSVSNGSKMAEAVTREEHMGKPLAWLRANLPGFESLSDAERNAITDFSLLWSLFEARILNTRGNVASIRAAVEDWSKEGILDATALDEELAYFRDRYFANGQFTHYFDGLNLNDPAVVALVRAVIDGSDDGPTTRVAAILIIIYRYRNNLFHGVKWQYSLHGQLGNFTVANDALMKVLERHGALGGE